MLAALGPGEARRCLSAFEGLCHARCARAGSDEAVFANFVMMAARGTAGDAQPIAALIFDLLVIGEAADCARTIGASLAGTDEAAPSPSLTTH